jgi:L-lactate dehydrogenase complex protein LldE
MNNLDYQPQVGLLVTCLVDLFRPQVGLATVKLLEQANCQVKVPLTQTCCGQPAYNSGDWQNAKVLAKQVINTFANYDYLVAPSGSCIAMLKNHYPKLFQDDVEWRGKAEALAKRCYELSSFLTTIGGIKTNDAHLAVTITYHDSCMGLRELGIRAQPRQLLQTVKGLNLVEMNETNGCCGFGGTFCVKYPSLSTRLVADKVNHIQATGAPMLVGGDMGCLLNIAGYLKRLNSSIKVYHLAEVLVAMTTEAKAIGEGEITDSSSCQLPG